MKRILTWALLALSCLAAAAQTPAETPMMQFLRENPRRAAFNTHSYEFLPLHDTPAPKGYKPFYISHYGRHGSRSEWGGKQYELVRDVLAKAQEKDLLTPAGDSLLRESAVIFELYNGMDGRLTPRGVREHAALAERMYRRYPGVFKNGCKHIRAVSSMVPRCIVSMNGFTARLSSIQPDLDFDLDTGEAYQWYIAQGDNGTVRERTEAALKPYREKRTADLDKETFLRILFTDPQAAKGLVGDPVAFQSAMYATARVAEAFDIDDNLFRYMPLGNVAIFHEFAFLPAYLNECDSKLNGDIRVPLNKPLVDVLIRQADDVVSGRVDRAADLTFGHDWPALGLMCYLGLEGVSERLSIEEAAERWLPSKFCPFATNLQMIFYRGKKADDVLVKFLMNEQETRIPALTPVQGPYYRWSDVKEHVARRVPSTEIVAHRGYWNDNAQNSIASLKKAQGFGCWGSEFDLRMTSDGVVVVNHNEDISGVDIQTHPYSDIQDLRLLNEERIPTLDEYILQGMRNHDCRMVLELKPHATAAQEDALVEKCIVALKTRRVFDPGRVVFISFSHHICQVLAQKAPGFTVQYLEGDIAPSVLHAEGINGIDYHYSVFYKHPEWVKEAHDLGMSVNVWTVDRKEDIVKMRDLGVDQITTNDPALTREILWNRD